MKISDVENAAKRKERAMQEQVKLEKEKLAEVNLTLLTFL